MKANLILSLKTSKFEARTKFLSGIGLVVQEGDDQLLPLFGDGRGARVRRGDFEFNLEESHSTQNQAEFYLTIFDYSDEEIERAKNSGYDYKYETGFGEAYTFTSPDGGKIVIG